MKLARKTIGPFIILILSGMLIGSLCWEVIERLIRLAPSLSTFTLTVLEPIKIFDFYVLSMSFRANPGTLAGLVSGVILFIVL
jgi:hypothetical protein